MKQQQAYDPNSKFKRIRHELDLAVEFC